MGLFSRNALNLHQYPPYECPFCINEPGARAIVGHPVTEVQVGDSFIEAVDRFCYLGDMPSVAGGCKCAWGKFHENLPLLTARPVPLKTRGASVLFSCL